MCAGGRDWCELSLYNHKEVNAFITQKMMMITHVNTVQNGYLTHLYLGE